MKIGFSVISFFVSVSLYAQNTSLLGSKDTLKSHYFTGGVIDSIDISFSSHSTTLSGSSNYSLENTQPYDLFIQNKGGTRFRTFNPWKKVRFSALPHLGFGYIFGTQATQIVKTNYTHAFKQYNLLNVDYNLNKGSAYLRSNAFENHDVQLQFQHIGKVYSLQFRGQYMHNKYGQNGGVTTDSLIPISGLIFTPVNKDKASSKYNAGRIEIEHFVDFLTKDSINSLGLFVDNQLFVFNRKYREVSDTLGLIYPTIYFNADSTNDQYQLSSLTNGAGVFYNRNEFFIKAGVTHKWWNFFNIGNRIAQFEMNLNANMRIKVKAVQIENQSSFNFIGANGEWFSNTSVGFKMKQFHFKGYANVNHLLPDPFQRFYFSNTLIYLSDLANIKKQFNLDVNAQFSYQYKQHQIGVFAKNAVLTNNYWFYDNKWVNDTLQTLNALSVGLFGKTSVKAFHIDLRGSYNASNWMPNLLIQSRIYVQGRLFKGRKLLAQIGVEASYHTGYKALELIPVMDIFRLSEQKAAPMANLHLFGAFEVQRFRFFFRAENFGYFWTDRKQLIAVDYPIPAIQIRVGITWDFFN
jgi:hypothetical protein